MVLARNLNANLIIAYSRKKKRLQILGAPEYTPLAALYGEIGATTVDGRHGKIQLRFGQCISRTICLDNI